jgi:phage terminase large subunit
VNGNLKFLVPPKLWCFFKQHKRYKIAVGGRGSGKSMTIAGLLLFNCSQFSKKICSMREFQSSIDDSSYALFVEQIDEIGIPGFDIKKTTIDHLSGGQFRFKGLSRSIQSIKSFHGFDIFHVEEGQFLSEESIRIIKPTLRKPGSEFWLVLNPGSSDDPVSHSFLNFCWDDLLKHGVYEDDMFLVVRMNYDDNPMFPAVLEEERKRDFLTLPRALYDHIWKGDFNDSIEDSLITKDWFDACIDAHKKLGFKPRGAIISAYDPADTGSDPKGFACRHGSVILEADITKEGDINTGCDWGIDLALDYKSDFFSWDAEVMGVGLKRQIASSFDNKPTVISMFRGSDSVDYPEAPVNFNLRVNSPIRDDKKNKDAFKNKRAQYYFEIRKRVYNTYKAVVFNEYIDPEEMISFSSDMTHLNKLRSELCRLPVKPNGSGMFELFTKKDMKSKFKLASPNLADSVMMTMRVPNVHKIHVTLPEPVKPVYLS